MSKNNIAIDHQFHYDHSAGSRNGGDIAIQFKGRNYPTRFQLGHDPKGGYWAFSLPVVISDPPPVLEPVETYGIGGIITLEGQDFEIIEEPNHNIAFRPLAEQQGPSGPSPRTT